MLNFVLVITSMSRGDDNRPFVGTSVFDLHKLATQHKCCLAASLSPGLAASLSPGLVVNGVFGLIWRTLLPNASPQRSWFSLRLLASLQEEKQQAIAVHDSQHHVLRQWLSSQSKGESETSILRGVANNVFRVPEDPSLTWEVVVPKFRDISEHVLSSVNTTQKLELRTYWDTLHKNVCPEVCDDISDASEVKLRSACMVAGLCVCRDEAAPFRRMVATWQSCMRAAFPKDTTFRRVLDEGSIVLSIQNDSGARRFFHVSYVDLNSWEVSLLRLVESSNPLQCVVAEALSKIALTCACEDLANAWT
jgi:hypothetical protein